MRNSWSLVLSLFLLAFLSDCGEKESEHTSEKEKKTTGFVPIFNGDSAYVFVAKQVAFGPRVPNTKAHQLCGDFLTNTLRQYGATVIEQEFDAKRFDDRMLKSRNIIGIYNPDSPKRILLAAHWDTRFLADKDTKDIDKPIDGANDGGSGVGVLLEIARLLQQYPPKVGVDIIFFDAEDQGTPENQDLDPGRDTWCLGSQYWARNKHILEYSAYYGILLDMVGAKDAKFAKDGTSKMYAAQVQRKVWDAANLIGFGHHFIMKETQPITDDHFYINLIAKIPMVDIIEYKEGSDDYFGPYHHTHGDNMDIIDPNTLKAVGQTVLYLLYNE